MKNEYRRPILQINFWCVTIDDLKYIFDFFEKRINEPQHKTIDLNANFVSGNNINSQENPEIFLKELGKRYAEKEELLSIELQITYHSFTSKDDIFKDLFLRLNFDENYSEFEVRACDSDNSLRDWVDGTYEDMKKIKKRMEIEEKYQEFFLDKIKNNLSKSPILKYYLIFDPFGEIKKEIIEEFKFKIKAKQDYKEEQIKKEVVNYVPVITINGNNNFSDIKDSFNNKDNKKIIKNYNNIEKWYMKIIIRIIIALIAGFLLYKFGLN
jgi:hypothetical protein